MNSKSIAAVSLLALFVLVGHCVSASAQSLTRLVVGYSSPSGNQAVLWVAKEAGSFKRHGLDVDLIFIGSGSTVKMGFKELVDMSEVGLEYPSTNIVVTERYLKGQSDLVRRFLMAFIEGIHRYKTDEAFTKKVIGDYARIRSGTTPKRARRSPKSFLTTPS